MFNRYFIIIVFSCFLIFTPIIYIHRPIIPFCLIAPYITWRTYDGDKLYHRDVVKRELFIKDMNLQLINKSYILTKNDYPYHIDGEHYILWVNEKAINIYAILNSHYLPKCMIKYFENPPHLRSIPSITHYHVFVKCKK